MKKVIGVYGLSGAGKTTFTKKLASLGAIVIDADETGRKILAKGSPLLSRIKELFGDAVIAEDGSLLRKKLGDIVFNSSEKLALLNSVTRPEIGSLISEEINSLSVGIIIIDCAMIKELEIVKLCDELVFITAPEEILISRLLARENISEETARGRIRLQMESMDSSGAVIIENTGTEEEFMKKCEEYAERLNREV